MKEQRMTLLQEPEAEVSIRDVAKGILNRLGQCPAANAELVRRAKEKPEWTDALLRHGAASVLGTLANDIRRSIENAHGVFQSDENLPPEATVAPPRDPGVQDYARIAAIRAATADHVTSIVDRTIFGFIVPKFRKPLGECGAMELEEVSAFYRNRSLVDAKRATAMLKLSERVRESNKKTCREALTEKEVIDIMRGIAWAPEGAI